MSEVSNAINELTLVLEKELVRLNNNLEDLLKREEVSVTFDPQKPLAGIFGGIGKIEGK